MARKNKVTEQVELTPVPTQAPDAASAATDGDTETVKRKVADHGLVDANGAKVEDEESANGITYQVVGSQKAFTWQHGQNADADRMLAIFGAKTLATNESSAARNRKEDPADADGQMEAVQERFALLATGKWVDRTREGVGAKIDKDALAGSIVQVAAAAGKTVDYATVRQKLEEDPAFVRATRQNSEIAAEYAKRAGRPQKTLDDVLAGLTA